MISKLDFLGRVKATVEGNREEVAGAGVALLDDAVLGKIAGGGNDEDQDGIVNVGYIDNGQYTHFDTRPESFNESGLPFLPTDGG